MLQGWVSRSCPKWMCLLVRTSQMNGVFSSLKRCLVTLAQEIWPGFAGSFFHVREWNLGTRLVTIMSWRWCTPAVLCLCVSLTEYRLEFNSLHLIKYYLKKKLFDGSLSRSSGYRRQGWPTANRKRIFLSFSKQQLLMLKLKAAETQVCKEDHASVVVGSSFLSKDHWRQRQLMVTCDNQWIYLLNVAGLEC